MYERQIQLAEESVRKRYSETPENRDDEDKSGEAGEEDDKDDASKKKPPQVAEKKKAATRNRTNAASVIVSRKRGRPPKTLGLQPKKQTPSKKSASQKVDTQTMAGDKGGKDDIPEPPLVARVGFFDETFFDLVPESSDDSPGHETQNSAGSTETVVEKCRDGTLFTHWKSTWEYNQSLTDVKRIELDEMVKNLRENPTMGTQDWEVITHCCMDDTEDNLFLACYKMRGMTTRTIQLVKAMPYSHWETQKVAHDVKMKRGGWLCVVLQPHYMDGEESNVTTRWRYQVHKWYDRGRKFSSFFYSFDSCDYVPKSSDTRLWCEPVYLLRGDSFVYGPFSWSQKEKGKRPVEFRVDVKTWEEALPLILGRGTKEGSLFWRGFDDILLKQAGCGDEEIEGNKKRVNLTSVPCVCCQCDMSTEIKRGKTSSRFACDTRGTRNSNFTNSCGRTQTQTRMTRKHGGRKLVG